MIKKLKFNCHVKKIQVCKEVRLREPNKNPDRILIPYLLGSFKGFKVFPYILQKKLSMHATF
jgi:hypothetical protein